jgi:hypothetical protein
MHSKLNAKRDVTVATTLLYQYRYCTISLGFLCSATLVAGDRSNEAV